MKFIEEYQNKLLFKKFEEAKEIIAKIKNTQTEKDKLELELFDMWINHDHKDGCDICEAVLKQDLYITFLKMQGYERELIYSTNC